MIRYHEPFLGQRYVLDTKRNIVHDLQNETYLCKIEELIEEGCYLFFDTYEDVQLLFIYDDCNGCYWCMNGCNNKYI